MKNIIVLSMILLMAGCATIGTTSTASAKITQIENTLLTVANVIQQVNTGLLVAAPTVESILTLTHNQGDSTAIQGLANNDAVISGGVSAILANVQNAIAASQAVNATPAAQQAAVSAALTPAAVAQVVAPIAAVTTN